MLEQPQVSLPPKLNLSRHEKAQLLSLSYLHTCLREHSKEVKLADYITPIKHAHDEALGETDHEKFSAPNR